MGEITKSNTALPVEAGALAKGLAQAIGGLGGTHSGEAYMKMTRGGDFVYGIEETVVEDESFWAINVMAMEHGWTAWGNKEYGNEGKNVGEVMVPVTSALPAVDELPSVKGDWSKAALLRLRCMDGEDEGLECMFKTNSMGGVKAVAKVLQAIMVRAQNGESELFPVVQLLSDSYNHSSYGKIHFPIFEIENWIGADGAAAPAVEEEVEEEAPVKAAKPKKPAKAKKAKAEKETPPPARQRRRKVS